MATHSSVLAWRIPGTGEPGGLPSTGLHRVGHDWSDLAAVAVRYFRDYACLFKVYVLAMPLWYVGKERFILWKRKNQECFETKGLSHIQK